MDKEKIADKKIFVKYVVLDIPPVQGLKRIQYYTTLPETPGKYYLGLSFQKAYQSDEMLNMIQNGSIIELIEPLRLPYEKDLWLDAEGQIIIATGYEPWEDKERRVVLKPRVLGKASIRIDRELNGKELPEINKNHIIRL